MIILLSVFVHFQTLIQTKGEKMPSTSQSYTDDFKTSALFAIIFAIIIFLNCLLANVIFGLPGKIHWALTPVALIGLYEHFCLICIGRDSSNLYWARGRGKLLIPIVFICDLILRAIPRITKQEWHKHRGLIIVGPINLIICLVIIAIIGIPFSLPAIFVSLFAVIAGYYSLSLFVVGWIKFGEIFGAY